MQNISEQVEQNLFNTNFPPSQTQIQANVKKAESAGSESCLFASLLAFSNSILKSVSFALPYFPSPSDSLHLLDCCTSAEPVQDKQIPNAGLVSSNFICLKK